MLETGISAAAFLVKFLSFLKSYIQKKELEQARKAQTFGELIKKMIAFPVKIWKGGILARLLITFMALLLLATGAAMFHTFERFTVAVYAFNHYDELRQQKEISSHADDDKQKKLDGRQIEWLNSQDPELVENASRLTMTDEEKTLNFNLSEDDWNEIFFQTGEYAVHDWENQSEVDDSVCRVVEDYLKQKKSNVFDESQESGGADTETKKRIAEISNRESELGTFRDKEQDMLERIDIYVSFPKASLALLISNDEHLLALTVFYYRGMENHIIYRYGKAIQYRFEKICFDTISKETIKRDLEWISQRYKDIAITCPTTNEAYYAEKLQVAFHNASNRY